MTTDKLLNLVHDYMEGNLSIEPFVDKYFDDYRTVRDTGGLASDKLRKGEKCSTIFCLIDLYNPDNDREHYEIDEPGLRARIQKVLDGELE